MRWDKKVDKRFINALSVGTTFTREVDRAQIISH